MGRSGSDHCNEALSGLNPWWIAEPANPDDVLGHATIARAIQPIAVATVSATMDVRVCEYVDHLHEHFVDSVIVRNSRYMAPRRPGYSIQIKPESRKMHRFPDGTAWRKD